MLFGATQEERDKKDDKRAILVGFQRSTVFADFMVVFCRIIKGAQR